jgi:GTP:adenosylcobinamide-phosphate guanylyltransferase
MTAPSVSALILAGRRGPTDPVAAASGVTHRALLPILGVPMLVRVARALLAIGELDALRVSIDDPAVIAAVPELEALRGAGRLSLHASRGSPAASVADAVAELAPGARLLVTTADHPLLTPAIVASFLAGAAGRDADAVVGIVPASVVRARFPGTRRTFVRLRDEAFTGANLFWLRAPGAKRVAEFWTRLEADRKKPWRIVSHFGVGTLLRFALGRIDLAGALARVSQATGARVEAVRLSDAEAAVDVDRPDDLALATQILEARERTG